MRLSLKFIFITIFITTIVMASVAISVMALERKVLLDSAERTKTALLAEGSEEEINTLVLQTEKITSLAMRRMIRNVLTASILGILALPIVLYFAFEKIVIKPVRTVSDTLNHMVGGDFSKRIRVETHDELSDLADSFNRMAANLQETAVSRNSLAREIGERKKAQTELVKSRQRFQKLLESAPFGILVVNKARKVVDINPAALKLIQQKREDVIGQICHGSVCPIAMGDCPIFDKGGTIDSAEQSALKADGQEIPILKSVTAVELEGEECLIESFIDIAERKQMEETLMEARTMSSLSRTTASIAHEMRTPLTAADMDLEDAAEEMADGEAKDLVLNAQSLIKETSLIIRSILKVYRGESQEANEIDLNQELQDAVLLFGRKTKGVDIAYDFADDDARTWVHGNLSRILVNLIGNALDVLQHQGRLKLATRLAGKNFLIIIEDNGTGIPPEILDKIFDPEFTTKKTGEGTGIGLWIARREIERIGGEITVESQVGKFTRFAVTVPRCHDQNEVEANYG